jgi:PAS domain S-box-containing protein
MPAPGFEPATVKGGFGTIQEHFTQNGVLVVNALQGNAWFAPVLSLPGKPIASFVAAAPIKNADGKVIGFFSVAGYNGAGLPPAGLSSLQQLAKQAEALVYLGEKALKADTSEHINHISQLDSVYQNDVDAIVIMDCNGNIVHCNPKAERLVGRLAAEAVGMPFVDTFIPARFHAPVGEQLSNLSNDAGEQKLNPTVEITVLHKSGEEVNVALGLSPTFVGGKQYYVNYIRDITERVLAARKIDEQKAFYENILNKLPTDIAVFDPQHRYLFVNPGAIKDEALRKFIIGKDDFEYVAFRNRSSAIAERRRDKFLEVINSDVEIKWEDTIEGPDGLPITHLRRLFPVRNEQGELLMIIGYGLDITERKIMENKQAVLVKQLSAQNTQLVDFCNIVSHNLRAPLVNISMLVQYIEESEDPDDQAGLIAMLKPVVENLHTTFGELVESIQIKHDHEVQSEKILLMDCINRTLEDLKIEASKSEAEFEINLGEAPAVYFPPKYLYSIFSNLISNALKYQSPERKPRINITTRRQDGNIILSVADNGLGIDLDKHRSNFFKIGKVFHKNPNAKGFGLFMTKTQVDAMGGTIWVESQPGKGATFFIEFKNQGL